MISWQEGARWFWDTLLDADLANNTLGWQWTAGCGADASPYFRIFNPVSQGRTFDPEGSYVRQWIPELRTMETRWSHQPWAHPTTAHARAAARAPTNPSYPNPIVAHDIARDVALDAYQRHIKSSQFNRKGFDTGKRHS
jgi:deoxyribodipyrimidine photo-lyase